jgi:hypothetical protein
MGHAPRVTLTRIPTGDYLMLVITGTTPVTRVDSCDSRRWGLVPRRMRFERAALRWLERLIAERDIGLSHVQLAAVALASLRTKHHQRAEKVLLGLL